MKLNKTLNVFTNELRSLPSRERGLKLQKANWLGDFAPVAPLAGAWIEISSSPINPADTAVAPLAGAWIEILRHEIPLVSHPPSLPSRERGLKSGSHGGFIRGHGVAPLAGAWIEIRHSSAPFLRSSVAPLAGAWIEIFTKRGRIRLFQSLPSRERGLKLTDS